MRAGAKALSLLAVPLNVQVLTTLANGRHSLYDLGRAVGSPPRTTMRGHLRKLTDLGILKRWQSSDFPGSVEYELDGPGRELLELADVTQRWLEDSPGGPVEMGSPMAKSSIKALLDGWSSGMVRVLAARPVSLTELNKLISDLNYPSLERRLGAMRFAGQIEPAPSAGRGTPYTVTAWLRRAIGPLAVSARWERINAVADASPIRRLDVEAAFLLGIPLIQPAPDLSGSCRLAVDLGRSEAQPAGVLVMADEGRIVSCSTNHQGVSDAWASGSAAAWLRAIIDHDPAQLELGGDGGLAQELLDGLHSALFAPLRR